MRWANAAVRQGDWKLLQTQKENMLFNLKDNNGENHNPSERHPENVQELDELLTAWKATHPPQLWDTEWTVGKEEFTNTTR